MSQASSAERFFGRFLVAAGHLTDEQLQEATDLATRANRRLGEFAVDAGMVDADTVDQLVEHQRRDSRRIGQLMVSRGFIVLTELEVLLERQRAEHIRLGEALMQLGYLDEDQLEPLLAAFHAQRPESDPFEDVLAYRVYESFPAVLERMCGQKARMDPRPWPSAVPDMPVRITLELGTEPSAMVSLAAPREMAVDLCCALLYLKPEDCDDDLLHDGMGELVNLAAGYIREGRERTKMGTPKKDALPTTGQAWHLATPDHCAVVVLTPT